MSPPVDPEIAILTRTFERPGLLARAGASVAAQTAAGVEWIVVNNGGARRDVEDVVRSVEEKGVAVRIVHHDEQRGRTPAANAAIEAASAPLLQFLDDDDTLDADCAAALKAALDARPTCVGAVGASIQIIERGDGASYEEVERRCFFEPTGPLALVDVAYRNPTPNNALMVRRSAAQEINGFDERIDILEDWDFLLRLLLAGDVCAAPHARSYYHLRPDETGVAANSALSAHREADVYRRNAYLREDIKAGRAGLGLLTNVRDPLTADRLARFLEAASSANAPIKKLRQAFSPRRRGGGD